MAIDMCNCGGTMEDKSFVGTEMKYKVTITAEGFDMDSDDWEIMVCRGKTCRTFEKADCVHREEQVVTPSGTTTESVWYLCFNTADFGPGNYYAVLTAHVPDADFPDNIRDEVKKLLLEPVEAV